MKKLEKNKELQEMPIDKLESMKKGLELQLIKARCEVGKAGASPNKHSPIKLVRDIKRQIARINTILNKKLSIKDSIERCKDKPFSKRREKRLRGKMKGLKVL